MNTMMMERQSMPAGMGMPGTMGGTMPAQAWMMMPRCTMKFEKCAGGMKVMMDCDDPTARSMMQHLCSMMAGGMCSMNMMMNGMTVCCCTMTMGMCKCDMTATGCMMTCTSGDAKCCEMIQACCDCCATMCKAGCMCCVMMNGTPVCCGC